MKPSILKIDSPSLQSAAIPLRDIQKADLIYYQDAGGNVLILKNRYSTTIGKYWIPDKMLRAWIAFHEVMLSETELSQPENK